MHAPGTSLRRSQSLLLLVVEWLSFRETARALERAWKLLVVVVESWYVQEEDTNEKRDREGIPRCSVRSAHRCRRRRRRLHDYEAASKMRAILTSSHGCHFHFRACPFFLASRILAGAHCGREILTWDNAHLPNIFVAPHRCRRWPWTSCDA